MEKTTKKQTAGRDRLGNFAPKFAELNDNVLFGEVWSREGELISRDRSSITITTLIGSGAPDFTIKSHLELGKKNGISKNEIAEMLTHIAFYAGWSKTWNAFNIAKEVYAEEIKNDPSDGNAGYIFGLGKFNEQYQQYFSGKSYLNPPLYP